MQAGCYALLSITFWGISFVSTKAVLQEVGAFTLLSTRFGIGAFFLFMIIMGTRVRWAFSLRTIPNLLVLAVLGVFVHQMLQAFSLLTIQASEAGWLISLSPIFTALLSVLFLHERFKGWYVIGMTIAAFGIVVLTTNGDVSAVVGHWQWGYVFMIASTLNWAVYTLLLRGLSLPYPPLLTTFYISLFGFFMTLPLFVKFKGWTQLVQLSGSGWSHLLFLGVFVSALAYWYWGKALTLLRASKVSTFLYLEPLATLIGAVLILHERIVLTTILGGMLILVGVILVQRQ